MYIAAMKSRDDKPPRAWNSSLPAPSKPMNRGPGPKRSARLASEIAPSRKPVRKSNPKRKAKEFQRAYGGEERVEWVKTLRCAVWCLIGACEGETVNAHTENGGMSRKADAKTIAPLCDKHHREYDDWFDYMADPYIRGVIARAAAQTEAAWQSRTTP
jgi:hypothetical protein